MNLSLLSSKIIVGVTFVLVVFVIFWDSYVMLTGQPDATISVQAYKLNERCAWLPALMLLAVWIHVFIAERFARRSRPLARANDCLRGEDLAAIFAEKGRDKRPAGK